MSYDLHIHSIHSDGTMRPEELVRKAIARGLTGIALTDHDTVTGISDAVISANQLGCELIPGIELTTDYGASEVHVLGYDIDYQFPPLLEKLKLIIDSRNERAKVILKKLNKHRIPLTWEKVRAKTTSKFVGRSHIFRAMEDSGLIDRSHRQAAFEYYLGKSGLAYEPHHEIGTFEAITLINSVSGIPVLAHPGRMENDTIIPTLVEAGLKGLEVYYPSHTPDMVDRYLAMTDRYQLFATGGTDYHGLASSTVKIGDYQVQRIPWR